MVYQNLEFVEIGVIMIEYYFDMFGGFFKVVLLVKGGVVLLVYIFDQMQGEVKVWILGEQVVLELCMCMFNLKWYEGMLQYGYEGVCYIEVSVINMFGWLVIIGGVELWVYQKIIEIYVFDEDMCCRLVDFNFVFVVWVVVCLLEVQECDYWQLDVEMFDVLWQVGEELEDRLEGLVMEVVE